MPADSSVRYVYQFSEIAAVRASVGGDWQAVRALLGGKGANLAEMSSLGIPVPPGFTISTAACRDFLAADARLPGTLWDEVFDAVITAQRNRLGVASDAGMDAAHWRLITVRFKEIYRTYTGADFPADPCEQLRLATEAVFRSWNGKRAVDYRNAAGIPHDLGTAVNIQTMVFGNMGANSATGVAMSRNVSSGERERELEGDFLFDAQGEDVVAGIRLTQPLAELAQQMPEIYRDFAGIAARLEMHYRNVQDMEFTIEQGRLWLLQTRDAKRTAQAEVRRAELIGSGLNVSPGAAVGMVALDAALAQRWGRDEDKPVIMVRAETKPDDVHGMLAARGVVTSGGGRTSHAALLPPQHSDFEGLFCAMEGRPVTIRLLDPPLHEFLPAYDELAEELANLEVRLQHLRSIAEIDETLEQIRVKQHVLERVRALREQNPMLGTRGVRLGIQLSELTRMQLHIGICGEHGGDPRSIAFCHEIGLDYVSCSPFRVPIARLAAAHAALGV